MKITRKNINDMTIGIERLKKENNTIQLVLTNN